MQQPPIVEEQVRWASPTRPREVMASLSASSKGKQIWTVSLAAFTGRRGDSLFAAASELPFISPAQAHCDGHSGAVLTVPSSLRVWAGVMWVRMASAAESEGSTLSLSVRRTVSEVGKPGARRAAMQAHALAPPQAARALTPCRSPRFPRGQREAAAGARKPCSSTPRGFRCC